MRINIELDEKESQVSTTSSSEETTSVEGIDGGTPSEQLIVTTSRGIIQEAVAESKEGIDAGTPPEWLLKAVESASPSVQIEDEDAGAPTE